MEGPETACALENFLWSSEGFINFNSQLIESYLDDNAVHIYQWNMFLWTTSMVRKNKEAVDFVKRRVLRLRGYLLHIARKAGKVYSIKLSKKAQVDYICKSLLKGNRCHRCWEERYTTYVDDETKFAVGFNCAVKKHDKRGCLNCLGTSFVPKRTVKGLTIQCPTCMVFLFLPVFYRTTKRRKRKKGSDKEEEQKIHKIHRLK